MSVLVAAFADVRSKSGMLRFPDDTAADLLMDTRSVMMSSDDRVTLVFEAPLTNGS